MLDITIFGGKQLIIVLFINILDNAIKFSPNSGVIELKNTAEADYDEYTLRFKDFGPGISKEDLDKIKEPF